MKIGILTVFDAVNYGSFLQAFCLQEYLKEKGHQVVMIKKSSWIYERWRFTSLFTYKPKKIKFKMKLAYSYFHQWKYFDIERNPKKLDLLIVGSDEMWEVNNVTFHTLPEYFGNGINATKKVTYAVSCNSTKIQDLEKYPFAIEGVKKFDYVSVRDQSTFDTFRLFTREKPIFCLDPTLLMEINKYIIKPSLKNYILCYTYSFQPYMIAAVKKLAQDTRKKIVVVGQQFEWADECIAASAFEFLGLIENADFIVTDTFHGATLSIALKKNFVAFAYKTKVFRALELFDLLDRNVNGVMNLLNYYNKTIDYNCVYNNWIFPLREQSEKYIDKILR